MAEPEFAGPVGPAAVTARGWGWRHAGRKAFAVSGLDLTIAPGEKILVLGPSGAGKSTLMGALAGVLGGADEGESVGELLVDGRPAFGPGRLPGRSGLVLQDPESQVVLARCGDDVAFGCENLGVPRRDIWPRVDSALRAVGLPVERDRPTTALSGGQKQRLALAGVLAMRAGLILLDEPTANLDPDGVRQVREAVVAATASRQATTLIVEHRVAVWRDVVDRIIVLAPGGGVLADGEPDDVLGRHGRMLAEAGVWVPEFPPALPGRGRRPAGPELLRANGLTVGRGGRRRFFSRERRPAGGVPAAGDIDVRIRSGRCLAISGPNGSGKSTLALTLAGLLPELGGAVEAASELAGDAGSEPNEWSSRELLTRIGVVFQDPELQFLTGSVDDELALGLVKAGVPPEQRRARIDELLNRLRLSGLARANPFTLSGGEKRRLSVATALATAPKVVVLDEPTFGQDAGTWAELVALLRELLDSGSAVVAVTHDADFIDALADDRLQLGPAVQPAGESRRAVA
ncbi:ABC transporter ATP-binding protein [Spelaeicoccus albus]|uniref:Energy-coupling factor transport system ATP-binding protein n=1 Tax=Spelaeicoccus albus TaxID=1280376 RepID=A0A7Z0A8A0_9MICO|nr:ABC transporter ATP-binding protein [Spelaeicoccus albus]NYI66262.1 energy-coupling factor transport system ATP-binding protein [Spelaeicoccus albus]